MASRGVERLFQFSLLGMVASGYFAVAGSGVLDLPTLVLTALALVVRLLLVMEVGRLELPPVAVNAATLGYAAFYAADYLFISKGFIPATVHLVFFLAITKILTARTDRDYKFIKVIAFMEVLAASLLSANLSFFFFLAVYLLFAVASFTCAEVRRPPQTGLRVVRAGVRGVPIRLSMMTVFIFGGILSITGGLFFFLPRTARAAFQHLVSERYHLPGFSSEITLGQLGEIKTQSTPVMHVRFIRPDRPLNLKWRGMALGQFDGRRWFSRAGSGEDRVEIPRNGMAQLVDEGRRPSKRTDRLEYEVTIKDIGTDTLFFAGVPEYLTINAPLVKRMPGGGYRLPFGSAGGVTYGAWSYLEGPFVHSEIRADPLAESSKLEYLELPSLDPRIRELATSWAATARDPAGKAAAIEQHLRRDYSYSLKLLSSKTQDPLAHFLFERRAGHCEYFASAMAVMLRSIAIPSRVVTGFQSGIYNPISGLQVIRASDAHSWVEAYLPGSGWATFDPTPPDPDALRTTVWTRVALYMDAAETFWREWVLNYDLEHQLVLATRVQQSSRGLNWFESAPARLSRWKDEGVEFFKSYGASMAIALVAAALVIFYGPTVRKALATRARIQRVRRGVVEQSDASLLYSRMLRILERRGIEKPAWLTANEFARILPSSEISPIVEDLTGLYNDLRFGGRKEAGPRMVELLAELEKAG